MQQKVPFARIRLLDAVAAKQKAPFAAVWREAGAYNIVESESDPLTRRPVDLFEKEPLKGNSEVHLHTPTKFGEDPSKDLGGDREHTHTNKRCSNYSMILNVVMTKHMVSLSLIMDSETLPYVFRTGECINNIFILHCSYQYYIQ